MQNFFHTAKLPIHIIFSLLIAGCATQSKFELIEDEVKMLVTPFKGIQTDPKNIFVFFDGTANTPESETNVWKLYQTIIKDDAPQNITTYCVGVGSPEDKPITGKALGRGMEKRILFGYEYILRNYRPNDNIFIFGFSRGAHQARALAGLIAYAGIPVLPEKSDEDLRKDTNKIIELTKKKSDDEYLDKWGTWSPGQQPLLAKEIKEKLGFDMQAAEIAFLGVWDTVPGSSLKNYGTCKEEKGIIKKYLYWIVPGVDKGERYKSDSYPPIRKIMHAVSLDEKRSKFKPLLICEPINPSYTDVEEVWFPGAHADVGGGYENEHELPNISLNWMIDILAHTYNFSNPVPTFIENSEGLAHWSIGDAPANIGSVCEDRQPPAGACIHKSVDERKNAGNVRIRQEINNVKMILEKKYPINCSD